MVSVKGMRARLVAYAPNGERLGFLPYPESWDASFTFNDVPALAFAYPKQTAGAEYLRSFCEIAVEVNSGNKWVEPFNARYLRLDVEDDATGTRLPAYKCVGYASLLEGAVVLPRFLSPNTGEYDKDGKRRFLSASVGQIIHTILTEARSLEPDLLPGLQLGFTPTYSSDGSRWAQKITIYYEPGTSLLTILDNLAQAGQCDWHMSERTLNITNPTNTHNAKPKHRLHTPVLEAPVRVSARSLVHNVLLVGEEKTWRKTNPGAAAPWGKSITVINQGGVKDEATASELINVKLLEGRRERVEYSLSIPVNSSPYPLVDFLSGDWVESRNRDGGWEMMRVHQITLRYSNGGLTAVLTLNDRFVDATVRAAKRQKGIVNGASGDAGAGNVPKPASPQDAVPKPPEGLVVESIGYWAEDGSALSSVRASWALVQYDTEGYAVDVSEYEVNVHASTVTTGENTAVVDNLPVGASALVKVRAVSRSGVKSGWVETTIKTEPPLATLPPSTPLEVSCGFGIVEASWDGKFQATGEEPTDPPSYFKHLNVFESVSESGPWTLVGTLPGLGGTVTLDRQKQLGVRLYYRGQAVNTLDQEGEFSPVSNVLVESAVDAAVKAGQAKAEELAKAKIDIKRLISSGVKFDPSVVHMLTADTTFANDLVANRLVISSSNPATAVMIADGAITAPKLTVDTAMVRKIFTDSLIAGKITTPMFSTSAAFTGAGVHISRSGVRITGAGSRAITLDANSGLKAVDANGAQTFRIDLDGNVTLKGSLTAGSKISGATVEGSTFKSYAGSSLVYWASGGRAEWTSPVDTRNSIEINSSYFASLQRPALVFNGSNSNYPIVTPGGIYLTTSSERINSVSQMMQGALIMESPASTTNGGDNRAIVGVGHHNTWTIGADYVYDGSWRTFIRGNGGVESHTGFRRGVIEINAASKVDISAGETHINGLTAYTGGYVMVQPQENGRLYYQGSARRFKDAITDVTVDPYAILSVRPRTWLDKTDVENHAFYLEDRSIGGANTGKWDAWENPARRIPGLIAEEVEEAGLNLYVSYGKDGQTLGLQYDRLWTLLIPIVSDINKRLNKLEEIKRS